VPEIVTIDRTLLTEQVGRVSQGELRLIFAGIDVVLDRKSGA
jgi:hypothetical protein